MALHSTDALTTQVAAEPAKFLILYTNGSQLNLQEAMVDTVEGFGHIQEQSMNGLLMVN